MLIPSIYINLEDDVAKIAARLKREKSGECVLVCPKRCLLFSDSINLRLLKKQADLLGKKVAILTMDERGQAYAKEAGFQLKFLPKPGQNPGRLDIKPAAETGFRQKTVSGAQQTKQPVVQGRPVAVQGSKNESAASDSTAQLLKAKDTSKTSGVRPAPAAAEKLLPKVTVTENYYPPELESETEPSGKSRRQYAPQRAVAGLVTLSLLAILGVVFLILPKATVSVYPKTEPLTRDIDINASVSQTTADAGNLLLPAEKVDETLEVSGKFQTQGKKEVGNASRGTIVIYNFSKQPLNLKAATTVLTLGSKTYHLTEDVQGLKVTAYKDAKTKEVDESTLGSPVEIMADAGGESYNVPAGVRLEISNKVFGSKPQFLFAKTVDAVTGGTSRFLSVVSQADIDSSRNSLGDQIIQQVNEKLKNNGQMLLEKAYIVDMSQFSTDKPAGTESPSFNANLKAKVAGLAISPSQLNELINSRISQTLSANKSLQSSSTMPDYKIKSVDLNSGSAVLSVHFEGQAVLDINLSDIASELTGKSRSQAVEILKSKAEVDRIDITLAPSWQRNFPYFKNKIQVIVQK